MARYLWPTLEAHNLTALAYHISTDRKTTRRGLKNAHTALNDCKTTLALLLAIVKYKDIKTFEDLYQFSEQARTPIHIFYGKYKGWAINNMDDQDIHWLFNKTEDQYIRNALENEILNRNNIDENEELPFQ